MKYIIPFCFLILLISGCNSGPKRVRWKIEFDTVEHYQIDNITHYNMRVKDDNANQLDSIHDYVIFDVQNFKLNDSILYADLESIGFEKKTY